jgi:threonine/homoserine/homoserine lactone efflux protein
MAQAFGTVLPLAIAIAIFPVPIMAAVLLLGSERGLPTCIAFVSGWCSGLLAVAAIASMLAVGGDASAGDEPATWVNVLLLGLGVAFLAAALKSWRGRPRPGEQPSTPGWMRTIDDFTMVKAALAGLALTVLNPKNVALTAAAAMEIAAFGLATDGQIAVVLAFVVVASLGVATPLLASLVAGARAHTVLDRLTGWMARKNAVVMAVLLALIGLKLLGDAVTGFV